MIKEQVMDERKIQQSFIDQIKGNDMSYNDYSNDFKMLLKELFQQKVLI